MQSIHDWRENKYLIMTGSCMITVAGQKCRLAELSEGLQGLFRQLLSVVCLDLLELRVFTGGA